MTSPYLEQPLRTEKQAMRDIAQAGPADVTDDPALALRELLSALTERDIAQDRVDRLREVSRLSLDRHYAAREAERRAEAEIAARMTT